MRRSNPASSSGPNAFHVGRAAPGAGAAVVEAAPEPIAHEADEEEEANVEEEAPEPPTPKSSPPPPSRATTPDPSPSSAAKRPREADDDDDDDADAEDDHERALQPSGMLKDGRHLRKRRTPEEAAQVQEEEEEGYADEARGTFRQHKDGGTLTDGNARSCGQDAIVTIGKDLGIRAATKVAVYEATLPAKGDTKVGVLKAYAEGTLGMTMRALKDHTVLGYSIFEQPGGPAHNLLLLIAGLYFVELLLTMPKKAGETKAKTDKHAMVYDAHFRRTEGERAFYGVLKDNHGDLKKLEERDRAWAGKPEPPPARAVFASIFPGAARVDLINVWLCERAAS